MLIGLMYIRFDVAVTILRGHVGVLHVCFLCLCLGMLMLEP